MAAILHGAVVAGRGEGEAVPQDVEEQPVPPVAPATDAGQDRGTTAGEEVTAASEGEPEDGADEPARTDS